MEIDTEADTNIVSTNQTVDVSKDTAKAESNTNVDKLKSTDPAVDIEMSSENKNESESPNSNQSNLVDETDAVADTEMNNNNNTNDKSEIENEQKTAKSETETKTKTNEISSNENANAMMIDDNNNNNNNNDNEINNENNNNSNNNNDNSNNNNVSSDEQTVPKSVTKKTKTKPKKSKKKKKRSPCFKRIQKEMTELLLSPPIGCTGGPKSTDSLTEWVATVDGPKGSPYENGRFYFDIKFPKDYPFSPPRVLCKTKIYHCNFASNGHICLDILKGNWSPALTITKVLLSIMALLDDPNPEDPLDGEIANHYKRDVNDHNKTAIIWTGRFAETIEAKTA